MTEKAESDSQVTFCDGMTHHKFKGPCISQLRLGDHTMPYCGYLWSVVWPCTQAHLDLTNQGHLGQICLQGQFSEDGSTSSSSTAWRRCHVSAWECCIMLSGHLEKAELQLDLHSGRDLYYNLAPLQEIHKKHIWK
jgi:hypothetical protein